MLRLLYFSLVEAVTSLWRSRVLNMLSVGTIMFAMFILGSFIFVAMNLKRVTISWQEHIQFNIFLREDISEEQRIALEDHLKNSFFVDQWAFISKQVARERFDQNFSGYSEVADTLEDNPFPASFQVALMEGVSADAFEKLQKELNGFGGVEDIYYDQEIFKRLGFFSDLIQLSGWFFGSIMIFSSIFTISNVLKLTFFTRREEVDIMKLVGASRAYIRGPFIVEGILIGILGATLGVALVFIGHLGLSAYLAEKQDLLLGGLKVDFLPYSWILVLLVSGGFSGLLGSLVSLHQFLEEHISYQ